MRALALSVRRWGFRSVLAQVLTYDVCLKTTLVGLYVGILYLAVKTGALFDPFREIYATRFGAWMMFFATIYSAVMLVVTLIRVLLVARYRPMTSLSDTDLPSVSVIS